MPTETMKYQAYSLATRTVAKTRQIVMLYDGTIRFIQQAKTAIEENRVEDRFHLLSKASSVLVGLQNSIDFDNGGDIAHVLLRYYSTMSMRVLSLNFEKQNGAALCDGIIEDLKRMRDVWDTIDGNLNTPSASTASAPPAPAAAATPAPATAPASGMTFVA